MQRLPVDKFHVGIIQIVADKRMTDIFHMDTDLMGAACLQGKGDEAVPVFFFYYAVVRNGALAVFKIYPAFDQREPRTTARYSRIIS